MLLSMKIHLSMLVYDERTCECVRTAYVCVRDRAERYITPLVCDTILSIWLVLDDKLELGLSFDRA